MDIRVLRLAWQCDQNKKLPINTTSPEATFNALAHEIKSFIHDLDQNPLPFLGLGVPGLVDADHKIIRSAADLDWYNIDIDKIMKEEIGWPTVVLNGHLARGLSKCRYGSGQSFKNKIYIG